MKIRNGFVSNSSSTSFVITDKMLTEDRIKNLIASNFDLEPNKLPDIIYFDEVTESTILHRKDYDDDDDDQIKDHLGALIIHSTDDNSIPWEIQEYIEDELAGIRFHWG